MTDTRFQLRTPTPLAFIESCFGWTNLTEDELRCVWVLERFLFEQNIGFHDLPLPGPHRGGRVLTFAIPRFGSYDSRGLTALMSASHHAAVRADVAAANVYYDRDDDERQNPHWWDYADDVDEAEDAAVENRVGHVLCLHLEPRSLDPEAPWYDHHPPIAYAQQVLDDPYHGDRRHTPEQPVLDPSTP